MAKEVRSAFCPVCGRAAGQRKKVKATGGTGYYLAADTESFWDWLNSQYPEGSAQFGVVQAVGQGRGKSFKVVRYFSPAEDQDGYYPAIKKRLLMALRTWLQRGWLTDGEMAAVLTGATSAPPQARPRRGGRPKPKP